MSKITTKYSKIESYEVSLDRGDLIELARLKLNTGRVLGNRLDNYDNITFEVKENPNHNDPMSGSTDPHFGKYYVTVKFEIRKQDPVASVEVQKS